MTDRDKLIKLIADIQNDFADWCAECAEDGYKSHQPFEEYFADKLLQNGVILPPCKVGQIVWLVRDGKIEETTVEKIVLKDGGLYLKLLCNSFYETTCRSIGKTVFLTKEEALKKLKELGK